LLLAKHGEKVFIMSIIKDPKKLKRVPIKEELVCITGDYIKAVILQQFIYWSERTKDYDQFVLEERTQAERCGYEYKSELKNGWIYKSSEQLSEETLLRLKHTAMRTHIKELVSKGFLSERTNPLDRRDRTIQYRVNILAIQLDLLEHNYVLDGYSSPINFETLMEVIHKKKQSRNVEMQTSLNGNASSKCEIAQPKNNNGIEYGAEGIIAFSENGNASPQICNATSEIVQALPETTYRDNTYLINNRVWEEVVDNLKMKLSPASMSAWILPLRPEIQETKLILNCSSEFAVDWIEVKYLSMIVDCLPENCGINEVIVRCDGS